MRVPRFFVKPQVIDLTQSCAYLDEPTLINQLISVLRLRENDLIDLLDGGGQIYRCRLKTRPESKKQSGAVWLASIESSRKGSGESPIAIEIALPMLRPNRYEWALEKLTELGATSFVPLIVQHSVVRESKLLRWQCIVKEAAEQCERSRLPVIYPATPIHEYLNDPAKDRQNSTILICVERTEAKALPVVLCNQSFLAPHKISVIVGAEGGFTENEVKDAEKLGAMAVSLGSRILRAETAAIYALSLIVSFLEQTDK